MAHRGRGRGRGREYIEPPKEEEKSEISHMQPEIMQVQIMEDLLKQKGLSASLLLKADRKLIIKYFYKHISPKYQRDYRENRRGKILKKMRQKRERERKTDEDFIKLVDDKKGREYTTALSVRNQSLGNSRDRLKPPPSFGSTPKSIDEIVIKEHKVRSKPIEEIVIKEHKVRSKPIEEIVIKEHKVRSKPEDGENDKKRKEVDGSEDKNVKKIKLYDSSEKRPSDTETTDSGKKIKLKRSVISFP